MSAFHKKKTCDESGGLAYPRPPSTPGCQIVSPSPPPRSSSPARRMKPPKSSWAPSRALPAPRQQPPAPPARIQPPPGVPPARSARRSPRGDREGAALTLPGAGCGPSSPAPGRPPRTLRPSPRRLLRRPWTPTLSFSSTLSAGKRKRKRPRGGPGPERAVNAERGPAARGGGPGPRVSARPRGQRSGGSRVRRRGRYPACLSGLLPL